ncbi:HMCN1 [Bugula neritina]|uniref:HMCN1 n=1 Tax=Bugula neritina TaxID=10212 RepID=A0A7J7IRG9_BUGNE|nr:HMCN1 [Bugula neritina]
MGPEIRTRQVPKVVAMMFMMLITLKQEVDAKGVSLVFVFDTTGSMSDELRQAQAGAKKILNSALSNPQEFLHDFILVPFNDPGVGPATVTTNRVTFENALSSIRVNGGGDCPEMAIGGIKQALEVAHPNSLIYVFTDAAAKDYLLTDKVIELIQQTQSKVTFVMTGDCGSRSAPGYTCYRRIAQASSGEVFTVEKGQVETILDTLIETTIPKAPKTGGNTGKPAPKNTTVIAPTVNYGEVSVVYLSFNSGGSKVRYPLEIDSQLSDFTISLTGDRPDLQVYDETGALVSPSEYRVVADLSSVYIIKFDNPRPGRWAMTFSSSSFHTLKVTGSSIIDFNQRFGVSDIISDFADLFPRPVSGIPSYTFIEEFGTTGVQFTQLDFLTPDGQMLSQFTLNKTSLPNISAIGFDEKGFQFTRVSKSGLFSVNTTGIEQCQKCAPGGTSRCVVVGKVDLKNLSSTKFRCECRTPYFEGNGVTCTNVNECTELTDNCNNNAVCTDTFGSFYCDCKPGFAGNGVVCANINECLHPKYNGCQGTGVCTDTIGSFQCSCFNGFEPSNKTAPLCADINECERGLDSCSANHECVNTIGSYSCVCKAGFTGNSTHCENSSLNFCHNDSVCIDNTGSYSCRCKPGFQGNGLNCSDINECADDPRSLCDIRASCINTPGSFHCDCNYGYTGNGTWCTDIDECQELLDDCDPKYGVCTNTDGGHLCTCIRGYTGEFNCTEVGPSKGDLKEQEKYLVDSAALFEMYALEAERQSLDTQHENLLRKCALAARKPTRGKRAIISGSKVTIDRKHVAILSQAIKVAIRKLKADVAATKIACGLS